MPLVKPVHIEQNTSGRTLGDLLEADELDAIIGTTLPASIPLRPGLWSHRKTHARLNSPPSLTHR
jgi:hypothetical protein